MDLKRDSKFFKYIINKRFDLDLDKKTRKREYINARSFYCRFMRERGYTSTAIGRTINKDHATVLHLNKNFDWHLKTDRELSAVFNELKYYAEQQRYKTLKEFNKDIDEVIAKDRSYYLSEQNFTLQNENKSLYSQIFSLQKDIDRLEDENKDLKSKIKNNFNRFGEIYKMVELRTREGYESEVLRKLNTIYNGLYTK